jgi:hypothetical protein
MSRLFGWDLPPGCTQRHIDEACGGEGPCECCGNSVDACICPQCLVCEAQGDPDCYIGDAVEEAHLKYTNAQLVGQTERRILELEQQLSEEHDALEVLQRKEPPK